MSFLSHRVQNSQTPLDNQDPRTIVFINSGFPNCDTLVQEVIPEARVIVIGSEDDGVIEITKILNNSNCREVHIISSGCPGCLYLGKSEISLDSLTKYTQEIQSWFDSNVATPDYPLPYLSLYGCNLAVGDAGEEFISKLNQISRAKITVSTHAINSNVLRCNYY